MLLHPLEAAQVTLVNPLTPVTLLVAANRPQVGRPVPAPFHVTAQHLPWNMRQSVQRPKGLKK